MANSSFILSCHPTVARRQNEGGFAMLAVVLSVAVLGVGLTATELASRMERDRDRERELLFVGSQFEEALRRYRDEPRAATKEFPKSLDDLLEDRRAVVPVRHLRRIYVDPITGSQQWGLVRQGERITGVYTLSRREPVSKALLLPKQYERFAKAKILSEWVFDANQTSSPPAAAGVPPGNAPPAEPNRIPVAQ